MTAKQTSKNPLCKMPPRTRDTQGNTRCVGVEVEMGELSPLSIARVLQQTVGGDITLQQGLCYGLVDTDLGDFFIELDAKPIQDTVSRLRRLELPAVIDADPAGLITDLAEQLVPWELVSPPLPLDQLDAFNNLLAKLRGAGAKGTRYASRFAFGLHLNPDVPGLDVDTLLRYFRAYLCLHDGICAREDIDWSRRLMPHIRHFSDAYIAKVIEPDYAPTLDQFMDDYLEANPTRNRSLDLLPLFAHLDPDRVARGVDDERVKARPAFHFRLPNCDIDNPAWGLHTPWHEWLAVEFLAEDEKRLEQMCLAYRRELQRFGHSLDQRWQQIARQSLLQ
ncbi:amidoligase family protein [Simiduia agarivorans]|nr:amidoligase family protein [Simiduia agarivorans]